MPSFKPIQMFAIFLSGIFLWLVLTPTARPPMVIPDMPASPPLFMENSSFFFDGDEPPLSEETPATALLPGQKYAFLTFDDGPSKNTAAILDILDDYGVKGTFFVLGHSINGRNDSEKLLLRMASVGHYIGLHSMSHDVQRLYYEDFSPLRFLGEMTELQDLVFRLTGGFETNLCRAPYGTVGTFTDGHVALVSASPFTCWDWNVDSHDWELEEVDALLNQVKHDLNYLVRSPHAVILLHEKDITVEALPYLIEFLQTEGYELRPYNPAIHFPLNFLDEPNL
ncbi:MAG: polysaccharide deacetylase [Turicibacter sp.]|nr:polysaccharide deacetylase [Turicibacter sp.]